MKLTKIQALKQCLALWRWLEKNPEAEKQDWPGWKRLGKYNHNCPCCEFASYGDAECLPRCVEHCPLTGFAWTNTREDCMSASSDYNSWFGVTINNPMARMRYAHAMVKAIRRAYARAVR